MKGVPRIDCVVDIPESVRRGSQANAFRVLSDDDGSVVLDFCLYSAKDNHAEVVSRVRITSGFLPLVWDRIREALQEIRHPVSIREGDLRRADGRVVLLDSLQEEQ
jgi:hypothetical protein